MTRMNFAGRGDKGGIVMARSTWLIGILFVCASQMADALPQRLILECGALPLSSGRRIIGYQLHAPGAVAVYHNSLYEEQTTFRYEWSCPGPIDDEPTIGLQSNQETAVFPIDRSGANVGQVTVKGRGDVRFVNVFTQTFSESFGTRCACGLTYGIAGTTLSLSGLQQLNIDASAQGRDLQVRLKDYKLQKRVLLLLQESHERLREIRANLNLDDPFEFVVSQKIDEILAGQDVGVTSASVAEALESVKAHVASLRYFRNLLANAVEGAEDDLRQQIVSAWNAVNDLIVAADAELRR